MSIKKITLKGGETRYRADWRDSRGVRHIKVVETRTQALDLVASGRVKRRTGDDVVDANLTVAELCQRFLASRAGEAPGTRALYGIVLDLYVIPTLGHLRTIELRRSHVEALRNELRDAQPVAVVERRIARALAKPGISPEQRPVLERALHARYAGKAVGIHTVRKVLATLVSVLNYGIDEGVIRSNVAARVRKPSLRRVDGETGQASEEHRVTEQDILTTADFARVIQQVPEHYRLLVRLAFLTGARQGELLGLQWTDLDRGKGSLRIERSWRGGAFAPLKTASSRRTVLLDSDTVQELVAWQLRRQAIHERGLMFATLEGKPIDAHNLLKRVWKPALRRAGLPYRKFHALRHSCASLLLAAGEPVPSVAKQLGHASIRMTLDVYAHFVPSGQASGAKVLASQLSATWKGFGKVASASESGSAAKSLTFHGGRDRDRTCDPYHVKVVLYR
jgi:integrase